MSDEKNEVKLSPSASLMHRASRHFESEAIMLAIELEKAMAVISQQRTIIETLKSKGGDE